jgi:hypothetical protein
MCDCSRFWPANPQSQRRAFALRIWADKLRKDLAHPERRLARLYANGIFTIAMFVAGIGNGALKA